MIRNPDFTLSAGPTMATARTLAALGSPITYHYDPQFLATFDRVQANAAVVMCTENDVLLMQGEAILGLEAAARSLVSPGMHVLNLVQGVFGKGMGYWLRDFGAELHEIEVPYNDAVDPGRVDAYLEDHPEIRLIAMVHSETPSGTVTDCAAIGPIARRHGVLTLVDAVSSIGGMPFETDAWAIDVCVTGAQKCLGGPPGITMVSVSDQAWAAINANPSAPRDSYLSMLDWKTKWLGDRRFPYTPSVVDVNGLDSVLLAFMEEGSDHAFARHDAAAAVTRAGVLGMGLQLWPVSEEISANCLTSIGLPEHVAETAVRELVRNKYGVMLSGGQGAGNIVRIAHMGPTASGMYPLVGLAALGQALRDLDVSVAVGAGIEAALETLSSQSILAGSW